MIGETNVVSQGTRDIGNGDIIIQKSKPTADDFYSVCDGSISQTAVNSMGYPYNRGDYELTMTNSVSLGSSIDFNAICNNGSTFVTVGSGGKIYTSSNGTSWTNRTSEISINLNGVAYGNNKFVAVGNSGVILISSNGTTWNRPVYPSTQNLNDVIYQDGVFIVIGANGTILTSSDGVGWIKRTSPTTNSLNSIAYGHGNFVVVGNKGTILLSITGEAWELKSSGITNDFLSVVYGKQYFWAVGSRTAYVKISTTGANWSDASTPTNSLKRFYYDGILFDCDRNGSTHISTTGEEWTDIGSDYYVNGLSVMNGNIVLVGRSGNISIHTAKSRWVKVNTLPYFNGVVKLSNSSNFKYYSIAGSRVLGSDNLVDWHEVLSDSYDFDAIAGNSQQLVVTYSKIASESYVKVSYNSGETWTEMPVPTTYPLSYIAVEETNRVFYVATSHIVYYGDETIEITDLILQNAFITDMKYLEQNVVAVSATAVSGTAGIIYYSIAGGAWKTVKCPTGEYVVSMCKGSVDTFEITLVTNKGNVYGSSNISNSSDKWSLLGTLNDFGLDSITEVIYDGTSGDTLFLSGTDKDTLNACVVMLYNSTSGIYTGSYLKYDTGAKGDIRSMQYDYISKNMFLGRVDENAYYSGRGWYKLPNYIPTAYQRW